MTNAATIIQTISKAATIDDIAWYLRGETNKALYNLLSINNVKGRSKLTKKSELVAAIMEYITSGATLRSEPINKRELLDIKKLANITDDNTLKSELKKYKVAELKDVLKLYKVKGRSKITKKADLAEAVVVIIRTKDRRAVKAIDKVA